MRWERGKKRNETLMEIFLSFFGKWMDGSVLVEVINDGFLLRTRILVR